VNGSVNADGMENYWRLLKRGIRSTYAAVEPFRLSGDLEEEPFRYSMREPTDEERSLQVARIVEGKRLEYGNLIDEPS
jgi:hypothetical protein